MVLSDEVKSMLIELLKENLSISVSLDSESWRGSYDEDGSGTRVTVRVSVYFADTEIASESDSVSVYN